MLAGMAQDWSAWEIFWSDERCLPADHSGRNSYKAHKAWLSQLAIPARQIHPIPAELGAARAAEEYTTLVIDRQPFDLVLLGMGEDGHTASLFSTSGDHISPVIAVHGGPKPPSERVSLNFQTLRACRKQLVLITGAEKSPALFAWEQGANLPIAHVVRSDACLLADFEAGRSTNFMAAVL
jgi:6-phosphogluconolactonase